MPEAAEQLRRRPLAAPQARDLAARALDAAGAAPDDPAVSLVVTELVANAVRHGRGRRIWVRLVADGDLLRVEVENRCWTTTPRRRLNELEGMSGRGLRLVDALSRSWGVVPEPGGRTRVWAEVPLGGEGPTPGS